MIMKHSFSDDEEPQQLHSLQQQLGQDELDNWMGKKLHHSFEEKSEDKVLSSFDINVGAEGEISEQQFSKRSSHCQDVLDVLNARPDVAGFDEGEGDGQGGSSISGQTFYEQSGSSSTMHRSVEQAGWRRESGQALIQFSSISEHIYLPLMDNLSKIMEQIQQLTNRTTQNLDMYHNFFRIKLEQQSQRCEVVRQRSQRTRQLSKNQLMEHVYIEERAVFEQLLKGGEEKVDKLSHFCDKISESCHKLQVLLSKTLQLRNRKINHIFRHLSKTHALYSELLLLIQQPPSKRPIRWVGRTDLHCDRYLQRKYLQERQKLFLHLLKTAGEKIVALMHCIFLKEEPTICSLIQKQMRRYQQLSKDTYGSEQMIELQQDSDLAMQDVDRQLAQTLIDMLPREWEIPGVDRKKGQCEILISFLNQYLQNQIFLPTVTIDPQLVLVKEQARWVPIATQKDRNGSKKENIDEANQASCSSLVGKERLSMFKDIRKGFNVTVVLTADKYLHLQCSDKIACLRLKKLKLKRKGQRSIMLIEKNKLSSLFSQPNLGELIFDRETGADDFAGTILSTI